MIEDTKLDAELCYYASFLCGHYAARMGKYKHLCREPGRMEDPVGVKECVVKYCPRLRNLRKLEDLKLAPGIEERLDLIKKDLEDITSQSTLGALRDIMCRLIDVIKESREID